MLFRLFFFCLAFSLIRSACLAEDSPLCIDHPEVRTVEQQDLKTGLDRDEFVTVDVRSKAEFDLIHIKDSRRLDLSDPAFPENLGNLAAEFPGKKIAVYGNASQAFGPCEAGWRAMDAGLKNVYVLAAGIFAWSHTYPSLALLFGKEMNLTKKQLITEEKLASHTLDLAGFKDLLDKGALGIDIREPGQRMQPLPGLERALPIPVDKFVDKVIVKGNLKDKWLLIFDRDGMQAQWLIYYLVDQGYSNFYFLGGGADPVINAPPVAD